MCFLHESLDGARHAVTGFEPKFTLTRETQACNHRGCADEQILPKLQTLAVHGSVARNRVSVTSGLLQHPDYNGIDILKRFVLPREPQLHESPICADCNAISTCLRPGIGACTQHERHAGVLFIARPNNLVEDPAPELRKTLVIGAVPHRAHPPAHVGSTRCPAGEEPR